MIDTIKPVGKMIEEMRQRGVPEFDVRQKLMKLCHGGVLDEEERDKLLGDAPLSDEDRQDRS